jgi:hypothetical protein
MVPSQAIDGVSLPAGNSLTASTFTSVARGFYSCDVSNADRLDITENVGTNIPVTAATVRQSDRLNSDRSFGISKFPLSTILAGYQTISTRSKLRPFRTIQFSSGERCNNLLPIEPLGNSSSLGSPQVPFAGTMATSGSKKTPRTLLANVEVTGPGSTTFVPDGKSVEPLCGLKGEKRKLGLIGLHRYLRTCTPQVFSTLTTPKTDKNLLDKADRMRDISSLYDGPTKQDASTKSTTIKNDYSNSLAEVQQDIKIRRLRLTRPDVDVSQLYSDFRAV